MHMKSEVAGSRAKRWGRRAGAMVSLSLVAVLSGPAALAASGAWGTSSDPQSVSGYGSWGKAYGNWSGTKVSSGKFNSKLSSGYYKFFDADDHTVYTSLSSNVSSIDGDVTETSHDNVYSSSWSAYRSRPNHNLNSPYTPTTMKATIRTCLDIPVRSDPCSAVKSFTASL
jgi:hypothetical protein